MNANRVAKAITDVLAPWVVIIAITAFVAGRAHAPWHGVVLVAGASLGPICWIRWRVTRGSLTDVHVTERDQRGGVFAALIASVTAVTAGFAVAGAPSRMTALSAAMLTALVATAAVTTLGGFKISMHTAVAAGAVAIAALDLRRDSGTPAVLATALAGAALVAAIGVARVVLRDHTRAQVVAGALVGATCAWAVFSALM